MTQLELFTPYRPADPHKRTCYVCGQAIQGRALSIGCDQTHPEPRYRHPSKCEPGSKAYMANRALARRYRADLSRKG